MRCGIKFNPEDQHGLSRWVVVWKAFSTKRSSGSNRNIAYLIWNDDRVVVNWNWLDNRWNGNNPVLLANLFISPLVN